MLSDLYILRMIVGCLATAVGIPGNITIIVVFTRQGIKNATDITFIALAVVDLIASFINGMKIVMVFFHDEHPWACYMEVIAARSALYAGLFLTIWIAIYRYQAVCKPFDRRIGQRAAISISVGCAIIAFGLHVPFFFITTSIKLRGEYGCNVYGNIPWGRDLYAKTQAIVFCASALGIAVLYLRIYKFIRYHQIIRQQMTTGTALAGRAQAMDNMSSSMRSIPSVGTSVSTPVVTISTTEEPVGISKQNAQPSIPDTESRQARATNQLTSSSTPVATISNTTMTAELGGIGKQKAQSDSKTAKAIHQPTTGKTKPSSKKLHNQDHKTTRVVIIITVIFFLLWLPNIIIDQIPIDQLTRILVEVPNGSFIIYFFYQIKYISHVTNVFVYVFTYRRFRQTCCQPCY